MVEKIRIAAVTDVPPGSGKELTAGGRVIALYNVDGDFHALDGVCPHAGGPLGEGELSGNIVTCPWHGWQFDVTTGVHCLNANLTHSSLSISVEAGEVFVELP
jgi:nitrite reductase/ring-hydroxylating ferredoxin subunit